MINFYASYIVAITKTANIEINYKPYKFIGKRDQSRRYLGKATNLDNTFGPAWLAYGHSFAVENEHDQAMAAYFKASQLLKGLVVFISHLIIY